MGLPIVTLARLADRKSLRALPAGTAWRLVATALLLTIAIPLFLTAAVATLPVMLTVGLVVGLRSLWHWQLRRAGQRRDTARE